MMNQQTEQGSKAYLISIVMVAVLGGLLFGYDTAVISGAEKGLQAFFMEAKDFAYTDGWHGFTSASALIGCIIGSALSGFLATNLGRKKTLIIAGLLFFIVEVKPMSEEEAILQMELLGHQFYIFKDAETMKPTLVYKRKEGNYGVIETQ